MLINSNEGTYNGCGACADDGHEGAMKRCKSPLEELLRKACNCLPGRKQSLPLWYVNGFPSSSEQEHLWQVLQPQFDASIFVYRQAVQQDFA